MGLNLKISLLGVLILSIFIACIAEAQQKNESSERISSIYEEFDMFDLTLRYDKLNKNSTASLLQKENEKLITKQSLRARSIKKNIDHQSSFVNHRNNLIWP